MSQRQKSQEPNVRELAKEVLLRIEHAQQYSNLALDTAICRSHLTGADRALLTAFVYGVTERRLTLDYIIDTLANCKSTDIDAQTRTALRLGILQIGYMDRIPAHAAVNESVRLAPRRSAGFVNAILRTYLRCHGQIPFPDREKDPLLYLSVSTSVPLPLCRRMADIFGLEKAEAILASSLSCDKKGADVRVNTLKISPRALEEMLQGLDISVSALQGLPQGLHLCPPGTGSEAFRNGLFTVQDTASQYACAVLDPQPDQTMIDACACPGSKSFTCAMLMKNRGHIYACDLHENKLSLVQNGAKRLGITILETVCADGRIERPQWRESADRVLCDVPCSGYGVIAKKPEIRYKDPADTVKLPGVQYAILQNCSRYLKKGGRLVYSTCTLLPEENQDVVQHFLSENPSFQLQAFTVGPYHAPDGMLLLTPDQGSDGFFIACMTRQ